MRRRRRGTALLFFLGVSLPLLFLGSFIGVDITRTIVSARAASNAAEAAAVAGASQLVSHTAEFCPAAETCTYYENSLDASKARFTAMSLLSMDRTDGPLAKLYDDATAVAISSTGDPARYDRVQVNINYTVHGLAFLPILNALTNGNLSSSLALKVTRTADLCSASYAATAGYCSRPTVG